MVRVCIFFFSSRRRHTRWPRDWSSDVCSSDLNTRMLAVSVSDAADDVVTVIRAGARGYLTKTTSADEVTAAVKREIGRASCRERVEISDMEVSFKKKEIERNDERSAKEAHRPH